MQTLPILTAFQRESILHVARKAVLDPKRPLKDRNRIRAVVDELVLLAEVSSGLQFEAAQLKYLRLNKEFDLFEISKLDLVVDLAHGDETRRIEIYSETLEILSHIRSLSISLQLPVIDKTLVPLSLYAALRRLSSLHTIRVRGHIPADFLLNIADLPIERLVIDTQANGFLSNPISWRLFHQMAELLELHLIVLTLSGNDAGSFREIFKNKNMKVFFHDFICFLTFFRDL